MPDEIELEQLREAARAKLFGGEPTPSRIGRYRVARKLGAGGMGVVYAARDDDLDREVAVKFLLVEEAEEGSAGRVRLLREARAMAKLSHPNAVHVYEVGKEDDRVFIAMELIRGGTLRQWVEAEEPDAPAIIAKFVEAGRGLAAAHDAGIVHRDFKPENVLVGHDGRARVLDFGLARPDSPMDAAASVGMADTVEADASAVPLELSLTRTGTLLGTPAYMSPEQFKGERVDARSDQFSFCAALFEALYGERPFSGKNLVELSAEVLKGDIQEVDPAGRGVPSAAHEALIRGLHRDPQERFAAMDDLLAALEGAIQPATARSRTRRWGAAALFAASFLGAAVAVVAGRDSPGENVVPTEDVVDTKAARWAEVVEASPLVEPQPEALEDDPLGVTIHRLDNGLTVYIAPMPEQPRIASWVVVHAGSRHEEEGGTGVAHLLEHMLFKGTTTLGALDWEAEAPLLAQRDEVAERLAAESDPQRRAELLAEVGRLEAEAAKFAIPDELSTVFSELGVTGVNGMTQRFSTTFVADVPSSRFDAWAAIEADRLRNPVFRGFFAELGAVGDEVAANLRSDTAFFGPLFEMVFSGTPDARLVTGRLEDLRRPPLAAMKAFHRRYYVPNNISIVLVGDIDPARALPVLRSHFGDWEPSPVPPAPPRAEPEVGDRQERRVPGDWFPTVVVGWRLPPPASDAYGRFEALAWALTGDGWNLQQRLVDRGLATLAVFGFMDDTIALYGRPAPGRTEAQLEGDFMALLEELAAGDIDPVRLQSRPGELVMELGFADRTTSAGRIMISASHRRPWGDAIRAMRSWNPDPADVARAAKELTKWRRHVVLQSDEPYEPPAVDLPRIPSVEFASGPLSEGARRILAMPAAPMEPQFLVEGRNYRREADGSVFVEEPSKTFRLRVRFPVGRDDDPLVCFAARLWGEAAPLGVELDAWGQRRDDAGARASSHCGSHSTTVELIGLSRLRDDAIVLFERALREAVISEALVERRRDFLVQYVQSENNPDYLVIAAERYALDGERSFDLQGPRLEDLRTMSAKRLQEALDRLRTLEPTLQYYGPALERPALRTAAASAPSAPTRTRRALPRPKNPRVLVLHDQTRKQVQVRMLYPRDPVAASDEVMDALFDAYLSGDMSALLFSELRTRRGVGYTAHGSLELGDRAGDDACSRISISTGAGRAVEAIGAAMEVLGEPVDVERFERARRQVEQTYRSQRVAPVDIPETVRAWQLRGHASDPRLSNWARLPGVTLEQFEVFYRDALQGTPIILIIGDTTGLDTKALAEFGIIERLEPGDVLASSL